MRRVLTILLALAVVGGAAVFAARGEWPWRRLEPAATALPLEPAIRRWEATDTLRRGESLGTLFSRHGIGPVDLGAVLDLLGLDPRRVPAGQVFRFGHHDTVPHSVDVTVRSAPEAETRAVRTFDRWTAERRAIRWTTRLLRLEGRIETSLFDALADAVPEEPLPDDDLVKLAWDLADVFAWSLDFSRDLQPGDHFAVVFERQVSELGEARLGRILGAELAADARVLTAFRFETHDGRSQYFDESGTSLRRAFLRAPVEFRRISSRFSRSRKHPLLGIWRSHQGVDYSAATGTPVLAAGDGTVSQAGWAGGYGRMIELRHPNGITTRYAHLRSIAGGLRPGTRVRQGEVIGTVGATGLATASHLHYEFRQNGVARDPSRIELGPGDPVDQAELPSFQVVRDRLRSLLRAPAEPALDAIVTGDR